MPGPLLAAVSGVLFGTWLGFAVTLTSSVLAALIGWEIGRRTGAIEGPHRAFLERRGLWAVIVQRLLPGIPDAPLNYVAGAVGVKPWDLALGTAIGVAPRAFAYTALGDAIGDRSTAQRSSRLLRVLGCLRAPDIGASSAADVGVRGRWAVATLS